MSPSGPRLSAVIAARNASATLSACLDAACAQAAGDIEVIVVDDCSTDTTAEIAAGYPVRLIRFPEHRGVAAARNAGARAAKAPIVLFLDADVVARPGLFEEGLRALSDAGADGVIGSYDDEPAAGSIVSQFKNLAHHHFHNQSAGPATTFWGACGFIRRDRFFEVGGFDERRFKLPSIEDVELGARLVRSGGSIRLDPRLQVTHLKRWTMASLVRTDIARRAIPWTILGLENGALPAGLNFSWPQRAAAMVALAEIAALAAILLGWKAGVPAALILLVAAAWLNRELFGLFFRRGGIGLAIGGFLLQQLYYIYSLIGLGAGVVAYCLGYAPGSFAHGGSTSQDGEIQGSGAARSARDPWTPLYIAGFAIAIVVQLIVIYMRRMLHPGDFDVAREFGRRFLTGENIYRGGLEYPYMPIAAMLFAPLAMLPAGPAFILRYAIAVGCLAATIVLLFRMVAAQSGQLAGKGLAIGAAAVILTSHYVIRDLDDAGFHLILLALIVAGVFLVRKGRDTLAALCISLPIAVKLTPGLLVVLMLWKRRWKLAALCIVATLFWIALPIAHLGASRWAQYQIQWTRVAMGQALGGSAAAASGTEHALQNQSLRAAIVAWANGGPKVEASTASYRRTEQAATIVAMLVLAMFGWWSRRPYRGLGDPAWLLECGAVLVLVLLLSPVTWTQHMVFMIPAVYLIVADWMRTGSSSKGVAAAMAVYALFALLFTREILGRARYLVLLGWHTQTICMLIVLAVVILSRPTAEPAADAGSI